MTLAFDESSQVCRISESRGVGTSVTKEEGQKRMEIVVSNIGYNHLLGFPFANSPLQHLWFNPPPTQYKFQQQPLSPPLL